MNSDPRTPGCTPDIDRPSRSLIERFSAVTSATAAAGLNEMGIRDPYLQGPTSHVRGEHVVGPSLTLQFMPKREDQYDQGAYDDPEQQLHRHCLYHTQPGDVVVVDARGDMHSGVFGEMMLSYFKGRGGIGAVVDGCIRDFSIARTLEIGLWLRGTTPNFHTQTNIIPFAVNVPIACGDTLVMPGDLIIADDDGAVVVPILMADELAQRANEHAEWEDFSRERLRKGGDLREYYPLTDAARAEYETWKARRASR